MVHLGNLGYDRFEAGLDQRDTPVAWTHRIVGPAIIARYLPGAIKDGKDIDAVDGAVQTALRHPGDPGVVEEGANRQS